MSGDEKVIRVDARALPSSFAGSLEQVSASVEQPGGDSRRGDSTAPAAAEQNELRGE